MAAAAAAAAAEADAAEEAASLSHSAWKSAKDALSDHVRELQSKFGDAWRQPPDDVANMRLIQLESGERKAGRAKVAAERVARVKREEAEEAAVRVEAERRERVAAKLARLGKA